MIIPNFLPLTPAAFAAALAEQVDPDRQIGGAEPENIRQDAIRIVVGLCLLFGQSLDRKTLWDRIATALASACAKVGGEGDIDRWIDLCLEHVRADPGQVVRLKAFTTLRDSLRLRDQPWKRAFLRYVENHRFAALAYGRERWEQIKGERAAAAAAAGKESKEAGGDAADNRSAAIMASDRSFEEVTL